MRVQLADGRFAHLEDWEDRHSHHPNIRQQIQVAESGGDFLLMYRGQRKPPARKDDLFLVGQKSRPAYYAGDVERLRYNFRALAEDESRFRRIAGAFIESPMHRGTPSLDELIQRYASANPMQRVRLAQLVIYGLQYQNLRPVVFPWRQYMFVLSCSTNAAVAIKYALIHRPSVAYVLEYAPPVSGGWFRRVADVIEEFRELHLGYIYPDRESEVFVNYGMFPHYLLGYAVLHRVGDEGGSYESVYVPNPWYEERGATLVEPPDLNQEQQRIIKQTRDEIAWIFRDDEDWRSICHPGRIEDISAREEETA